MSNTESNMQSISTNTQFNSFISCKDNIVNSKKEKLIIRVKFAEILNENLIQIFKDCSILFKRSSSSHHNISLLDELMDFELEHLKIKNYLKIIKNS